RDGCEVAIHLWLSGRVNKAGEDAAPPHHRFLARPPLQAAGNFLQTASQAAVLHHIHQRMPHTESTESTEFVRSEPEPDAIASPSKTEQVSAPSASPRDICWFRDWV
ncbi:MAG TPA: hypothetical protein VFY65_19410, partial [Longimicrobium sp.]|nr:hypothetical protein [Longimicrobium sp.]